jgi:glycosyltransferase involved in cell wall biosynthesis
MTNLVSVIIPCFNAAWCLRETMQSVLNQNLGDMEIIAIDDGSTDGTGDLIRSEFPEVQLLTTPNCGPSSARNLGTRVASARFLQYDMLAAGKLRSQVDALERECGDVAYGDWQTLIKVQNRFSNGHITARRMEKEPDLELFGKFWCPPAAYLFRREIVDRAGEWNHSITPIEDVRFALDCALHGAKFVYTPGLVAFHREHEASLSRCNPVEFNRRVYQNIKYMETSWALRGKLAEARRSSVIRAFGLIARGCYFSDRKTSEAAFDDLQRLSPNYIPDFSLKWKVLSRIIGYRNAVRTASLRNRLHGPTRQKCSSS